MNLDDAQRKKVAEWIAQGLKLSEIQNRITAELGITMTYMEVRLLVDDLKLTPKDTEPTKPAATLQAPPAAAPTAVGRQPAAPPPGLAPTAGVSVTVDQIARPGAVVSGKVTFSDGNNAQWSLDQTGQLGLLPQQPGYRPPASDVQQFQIALQNELAKLGLY